MRLYESLVSNVGIGPHIANEEFFKKLAKKRKADKIDYLKRLIRYLGIDENEALKTLRDVEQRRLINTEFHSKEIITKDWFEWEWVSSFKWLSAVYHYESKGGYNDKYYNCVGSDDLIRFRFDVQSLYVNNIFQKQLDKLDNVFKKYQICDTGISTYRVYYIKDSIKDLINI